MKFFKNFLQSLNFIFFRNMFLNFFILILIAFVSSVIFPKILENIYRENIKGKMQKNIKKMELKEDIYKIISQLKTDQLSGIKVNTFFENKNGKIIGNKTNFDFDENIDNAKIHYTNDKKYLVYNTHLKEKVYIQQIADISDISNLKKSMERYLMKFWFAAISFFIIYFMISTIIYFKKFNYILEKVREQDNEKEKENIIKKISGDSDKWLKVINELWDKLNLKKEEQKNFISLVSHEIRTPIAVMQGYLEIIEDWGREDEQVFNESIAALKEEIFVMNSIIEKILFIVREENKTLKLNYKNLDIKELVFKSFMDIKKLDKKHKYIWTDKTNTELYIKGDKKLIENLIKVIVENSIKYTKEETKIEIRLSDNNENIFIEIDDSGNGIPKEYLSRVFDKYYGITNENSVKTKGIGLGLTAAKLICELHNGEIRIESSEDLGTKVEISLPKVST